MNKISLSFTLLLVAACSLCFAQGLPGDDYHLKSQHQRTAAWVLVGGGLSLVVVGGLIAGGSFLHLISGDVRGSDRRAAAAGVFVAVGSAAIVGSIPLFIAAGRNARRAASIHLSANKLFVPRTVGRLALTTQPMIILRLQL